MGLLDGIFGGGGGATASQVQVDPTIQKAMLENRNDAINTSQDDYTNRALSGVSLNPKDNSAQVAQQERALGGDEPGMSKAISQRYAGITGEKLAALGSQAKLAGYETKANRLDMVNKLDQAKQNIDAENKQRQLAADNANESARNGALASVLGIGAMIAGTAIAGPVGGAVASGVVSTAARGKK